MRRVTILNASAGRALAAICWMLAIAAAGGITDEQRARVQRIEKSVLAPCCYTEPVSNHQSEISVKMRVEIAKWVEAGKTDREILDTYVQRYGSKVLVDPRSIPGGWTPWIPWLTAILGALLVLWLVHRWRSNPPPAAPSDSEQPELPDFE